MFGIGPRASLLSLMMKPSPEQEIEEIRTKVEREKKARDELKGVEDMLLDSFCRAYVKNFQEHGHPTAYQSALVEEIEKARELSPDFMEGYVDGYEQNGLPKIRRVLQYILGGSEEYEGNGDPVKVIAYKLVLEKRT